MKDGRVCAGWVAISRGGDDMREKGAPGGRVGEERVFRRRRAGREEEGGT